MAARTKIEWTDAGLFERVRALSRPKAHVIERHAVKSCFLDCATGLLGPIKHVLRPLRAVAVSTAWHDVVRLGEPTIGNGDDVVPSRGRIVAIGTQTFKFPHDAFLRIKRKDFESALSGGSSSAPTCTMIGVPTIPSALFFIQMNAAGSLGYGNPGEPCLAPAAPPQAFGPLRAAFWFRWPRRGSGVTAVVADIGAAIKPAAINREFSRCLECAAFRAALFAIRPARDVPSVFRSLVLRAVPSHA